MEPVGIRALKAQLSAHLKRVQAGARLAVTERGRVIATIQPITRPQESPGVEWARQLVADGRGAWSGGKPKGATRRAGRQGKATVADAVIEDRR